MAPVSISMLLVFEIFVVARACLREKGTRSFSPRKMENNERNPLPFANSTANYVPTSRGFNPRRQDMLSGISSLIPFRLLVDDVVVWIVLSAFFAFPPSSPFFFSLPPPFNGQSRHDRVLGRGFLFFYSSEQTRGRRDCFDRDRRMSRMVVSL